MLLGSFGKILDTLLFWLNSGNNEGHFATGSIELLLRDPEVPSSNTRPETDLPVRFSCFFVSPGEDWDSTSN
jgi:hypothetical protein